MAFQLRPYQSDSISTGVEYLKGDANENAVIILPTGAGKSIVIANIIAPLQGKTIIFQPSKEILEQNYEKYTKYGKA